MKEYVFFSQDPPYYSLDFQIWLWARLFNEAFEKRAESRSILWSKASSSNLLHPIVCSEHTFLLVSCSVLDY